MSKNKKPVREGSPSSAEIHPDSTVQGGSNFGQGSAGLSNKTIHQGEAGNNGSNYENESGWNNEALRSEDIDKDNDA